MSKRKDEMSQDIERLTEAGLQSALEFLIGFDLSAVSAALYFVKTTYPSEYRED